MPESRNSDFYGHVYAAEFEGVGVKIGQSANPGHRLETMDRFVSIYGNSAIVRRHVSRRCTNHEQLERKLHADFADRRIEGELFAVSFDEAVQAIEACEFRDDSVSLASESQAKLDAMKRSGPFAEIQAGINAISAADDYEPEDDEWEFWHDADILERMEPLARSMTVFVRLLFNKFVDELAKRGDLPPSDDLAETSRIIAFAVKEHGLSILGEGYDLDVIQHPERGPIIGVVRNNVA